MRRLLAALACLTALVRWAPAGADLPAPPHRFYGSVTINGASPADGTRVSGYIGAVECGRTETTGGVYRLEVAGSTVPATCAAAGQPIRFVVGGATAPQTAVWESARFTELILTASQAPFRLATLDLESPCIPAAGQSGCDAARLRLWAGESEAWRLLFRALGAPEPAADRIFDETVHLRLVAGDPALTSRFATWLGWPYVRITAIQFQPSRSDDTDEYVEIANLGGGGQEMSGWRLRVRSSGAEFRFRAGFTLAAGSRCRIYTARTAADSCPGFGFGATFGLWDDTSDTATLSVDYPALVADVTVYRADPARQPPPPALRGAASAQ